MAIIEKADILTKDTLFNALKEKPYIQIPFPITKIYLNEAMEAFFKFLELPDDIKHHIDLKVSPMHRRGDIGFKHRDPAEGMYNDSKDFFHFHPIIFKECSQFLDANPVVRDFINKAQPIWDATYNIIYQIMQLFDQRFPGSSKEIFDSNEPHIILRFLKYNWVNSGKYLAKPHFDAGSLTLAISESCPGLRIGKGPEDLEIIKHKDQHAIFMMSSNFQKIINTDEFSPGWHDVIQLDETHIGKPFARWAIVAFIDGHSVEALSRKETHKWYKEEA